MNIWISDSSPVFTYSPAAVFANTWQASWTSISSSNSTSVNNTVHETAAPAAVVLGNISSSGVTPIWTATTGFFNVALQVDGGSSTDWSPDQTYTTSSGTHSYELNINCMQESCSNSPFSLSGFWVAVEVVDSGSTAVNVTLDDSSQWITYTGFTSLSSSSTSTAVPSGVSVESSDYDQTLSMTTTSGASAKVEFEGSAILVTGVTAPSCGSFSVTLDSSTIGTYSSVTAITSHGVPLVLFTGLSTSSSHVLTITAESGNGSAGVGLVIDSITVYGAEGQTGFIGTSGSTTTTITSTPASTSGSTGSTGTGADTGNTSSGTSSGGAPNAGTIIGAIIGVLGGLSLLYYIMRRAALLPAKKPEKKLNKWDEANLLQNMKNEEVYVTTAAKDQRYVYPGLIAHSQLK